MANQNILTNTTVYTANSDNQLTSATASRQGITVTGYVEPGSRSNKWYASVARARSQESGVSSQNGTFAIPGVPVTGGANALTVTVTDVSGNIATQVVNVTVMSGQPVSIGYDANGNQTTHNGWAMTYDRENRLTEARSQESVVSYTYDPLGRLIRRVAYRNDSGSWILTSDSCLYYAGWQLIAEYDGAGNLQRKYVYGTGIDELVRMTSGSTNYYYHSEGLGSVTEITDSTGSVVKQYRYDVNGAPTIYSASGVVTNASAVGNRLLFTGRDRDPDTGWYNYRYRYYNPSLGRFVQPDPIGLNGGDGNSYRYCFGNPHSLRDPFGLDTFFGGMSLDYYGMFGGEGGVGYYIDTHTPTKGTSFDAGFYATGGGGVGINTSAGFLNFGWVSGQHSSFTGEALLMSAGGGAVTLTVICNPNKTGSFFGFKPIGGSITLGPGMTPLNLSASKTWTKAWSLYQWVDRKVDQFTNWMGASNK